MDKIKTYDRLLRDTLKSLLKAQYERRDDRNFANKLYDDIIKALNTPDEAEPDNGWISVKDKLPDDKKRYLICTEDGRVEIAYYQPIGDKFSDYESFWQGGSCRFTAVTRWQPLPEPPKGECK